MKYALKDICTTCTTTKKQCVENVILTLGYTHKKTSTLTHFCVKVHSHVNCLISLNATSYTQMVSCMKEHGFMFCLSVMIHE